MTNYEFRPLQPRTILNVLHHIRAEIVRENGPGLEHVDALLKLRGVDPTSLPIPARRSPRFKRGALRRRVLVMLAGGPHTASAVARRLSDDLGEPVAYSVAAKALSNMQRAGLAVNDKGSWRLVARP